VGRGDGTWEEARIVSSREGDRSWKRVLPDRKFPLPSVCQAPERLRVFMAGSLNARFRRGLERQRVFLGRARGGRGHTSEGVRKGAGFNRLTQQGFVRGRKQDSRRAGLWGAAPSGSGNLAESTPEETGESKGEYGPRGVPGVFHLALVPSAA